MLFSCLGWHSCIVWKLGTVSLDCQIKVPTSFSKRGSGGCAPILEGCFKLPGKVYLRVVERKDCLLVNSQTQEEKCGTMAKLFILYPSFIYLNDGVLTPGHPWIAASSGFTNEGRQEREIDRWTWDHQCPHGWAGWVGWGEEGLCLVWTSDPMTHTRISSRKSVDRWWIDGWFRMENKTLPVWIEITSNAS